MKTIEIKLDVTARDIAEGVRYSCCSCPIARSLKRHYKDVSVGSVGANIFMDAIESYRARLPERAFKFVRDFDAKLPVKPFRTTLTFTSK